MSDVFAVQITAVANVVLAAFAIVTAILAGLAFRKQAKEVSDQAEMLALQRRQLAEQEKSSAKQAEVLELQGAELRESLSDRIRNADEARRAQAAQIFIMIERAETRDGAVTLMSTASNTSRMPVYDLWVQWRSDGGDFGTPSVAPQFLPGTTKPFAAAWTDRTRLTPGNKDQAQPARH
jgi:hypothetical protein